ncbi:uncharacterized protein LOC115683587 [Syzygium oleosum]|uniref:uncharacterized protein LOC115683587 n=1 Tax=Syzygium oleosum TaxID=219896 RepID=UPI0011D24E12|nr:uncharacterized protein LOC115683587 [Syzygium oleosum]
MSRSSRQKERRVGKEPSHEDEDDSTAARTRPLCFEDIMKMRRSKESSQTMKHKDAEEDKNSRREIIENVPIRHESEKTFKDTERISLRNEKQISVDLARSRFRGKEGPNSHYLREDSYTRSKDKSTHEVELLPRARSRKKEERASVKEDILVKGNDRRSRELEGKLKSRLSSEVRHKDNREENYKIMHDRSKPVERARNDLEDKAGKGHPREPDVNERYTERSRGKSERESKRKHRDIDERDIKDRNMSKKLDPRRVRDSEILDRKERKELTKSRNDEVNIRRKRSRSRERGRDRRSISLSPKGHRRIVYNGRKHGESSSSSFKDRSERHHVDVDRTRFLGNGSSNHSHGHGEIASGLGGYSPRKRKTEKAIKTPSPATRSPERKNAGWDIPPTSVKDGFTASVLHSFQSTNQAMPSSAHQLASAVSAALSTMKPLPVASPNVPPTKTTASIDSIQLTESTRPRRRLYVENIPASASEKAIVACLNNYLLSSGVNHIQGTQPCISCIIHKEKGQALVEFLTPEDASAALSFDGASFSGSLLKIRRPKDFVEVATGDPGETARSDVAAYLMSDVVDDSPHKIFIGGISKVLSSEMLREIASVFGPLKAFHFQANDDATNRYAFLEYVDQSVTLKACAGLNGIKLGGQVLTVVQAVPDPAAMGNSENQSLCAIPDHARPLLEKPTEVLKLKNVFAPEGFLSLSELEVDEVLEDVRLECARFGTIKSMNVVKHDSGPCRSTIAEPCVITDDTGPRTGSDDNRIETSEEVADQEAGGVNEIEIPSDANQLKEDGIPATNSSDTNENNLVDDVADNDSPQMAPPDAQVEISDLTSQRTTDMPTSENPEQLNTVNGDPDNQDNEDADIAQMEDNHLEKKSLVEEELLPEESNWSTRETLEVPEGNMNMESDIIQNGDAKGDDLNIEQVFEPGCVLVEFKRIECSSVAAHSLHGRLFDERPVTVEYVSLDLYRRKYGG